MQAGGKDTNFIVIGFSQIHNIDSNANIAIRGFTTWKHKNTVKNVTPGGKRNYVSDTTLSFLS